MKIYMSAQAYSLCKDWEAKSQYKYALTDEARELTQLYLACEDKGLTLGDLTLAIKLAESQKTLCKDRRVDERFEAVVAFLSEENSDSLSTFGDWPFVKPFEAVTFGEVYAIAQKAINRGSDEHCSLLEASRIVLGRAI